MARLAVFVGLVVPYFGFSAVVNGSGTPNWLINAAVGGEDMPECSCACCTTQYRGDGTRWGRKKTDPEFACSPLQYSQVNFNAGFANCKVAYGNVGQYCKKNPFDGLLGRNEQVDTARYCFHECIPSSAQLDFENGPGKECIPAPKSVLKAAGMHEAFNTPGSNNLGNGVDLGIPQQPMSKCSEGHKTHLLAPINPGATNVLLENYQCLLLGATITVGYGQTNAEAISIKFFGSVIAASPLKFFHAKGEAVYMAPGPGPAPAPAAAGPAPAAFLQPN